MDLHFSPQLIICIIVPLFLFILTKLKTKPHLPSNPTNLPKSYPLIGSILPIFKNKHRFVQWTSEIVTTTPSLTFSLHLPFGDRNIFTANAANVQHLLKSNFSNYHKGDYVKNTLRDFLGDGIFNTDGEKWKFQRQVSVHEFSTKSLRKFIETVVDSELSDRLIPILQNAAADETVIDFQDILQRFSFDNICQIAFGYDPAYLSPSLPREMFAMAFEKAVNLSVDRFRAIIPNFWKIRKALNFEPEKQLRIAVKEIREFAKSVIIMKKKQGISSVESKADLLSRFLNSGHSDEDFVIDIVISFILAGKDTTSAALTWFFWLLSNHPEVEKEILMEIEEKSKSVSAYDEVKDMVYTHASLCETMRLYPPVPMDTKAALSDDVLPDGTSVKKGTRVSYHPYAMGRVEMVWGEDWAEFRPSRWLKRAEVGEKWSFVNRDSFTYPVFQAGPRICLGKEMAFLQMKRVVAAVLRRFKVVPVGVDGAEPVYITDLTSKMKDGFPVRIEDRV
ncbi:hypothetical protein ACS0TY_006888 [Phlomoides rotata]